MDELDVAFAGVVATGAIGVFGLFVALVNGRADRRHARQLAQDERLFARRSEVYEELLALTRLTMLAIQRTYPFMTVGEPEAPPDPPDDAEYSRLMARVAAFGSPTVLAALDDFQRKTNEFGAEALVQRRVEARPGGEADYPRMHRVREEAAELLEVLERRVREELTTPGAT